MDYCSACRRNLNGALVCPGCGAYAPDIAPPSRHLRNDGVSGATTQRAWHLEAAPAPGPYPDAHHHGAARIYGASPTGNSVSDDATADASDTDPADGYEGVASTGQGRAARRRQLARWKKNRRRAAAATAVALVGGGLTVAALPTSKPSNDRTHAAPPPEPVPTGTTPSTAAVEPPSEQPDTRVSPQPGTGRPPTAGRQQDTGVAVSSSSTTERRPATTAAEPPVISRATPDTAPEPAKTTQPRTAEPSAPATTVPAATERPDTGPTSLDLLPGVLGDKPTSPTHVCLIGVCIG
ncbi:SCO2400 family protein [Streptomyces sp. NPDC001970]